MVALFKRHLYDAICESPGATDNLPKIS
jgi:hypothetical protein